MQCRASNSIAKRSGGGGGELWRNMEVLWGNKIGICQLLRSCSLPTVTLLESCYRYRKKSLEIFIHQYESLVGTKRVMSENDDIPKGN